MKPTDLRAGVLALCLGLPQVLWAAEQVLMPALEGWEEGYRAADETTRIVEWVLTGESVEAWTEMVTFQAFSGLAGVDPRAYSGRLATAIAEACPDTQSILLHNGPERGLPVVVFMTGCPENPGTGQPEWTLFKVIGGREALYVAQKAWREEPGEVEAERWLRLMSSVLLCDPDRADSPCP